MRLSLLLIFTGMVGAQPLPVKDVKVEGALDYGQTSTPVEYSSPPKYRALVFNGKPGDQVRITVKSSAGLAVIAIANGALNQLAAGKSPLTAKLPGTGPDVEAFYIVLHEEKLRPATFAVQLERVGGADYLACQSDSDCIAVPKAGCCNNGYKEAVSKVDLDAYKAAHACKEERPMCAQFIIDDRRVARCSTAKKCELVNP